MKTEIEFDCTVYKKDSTGKVRMLHVYTEGAELIQKSGLVDGTLVTHKSTCKGKNIGKANETTPEQQAQSEAQSKVENKRSTGYFDTYEEALEGNVVLPMLAKSYDKESEKINWTGNVYVQPKLDGMRCLAIVKNGVVTLISRKGKKIDTVPHINKAIAKLEMSSTVLDGELYAHGKTFQENMKLIKKYREGETEEVIYHIYDIVKDKPYSSRFNAIALIVSAAKSKSLKVVQCDQIFDKEAIKSIHVRNLQNQFEGSIIRHGDDGYKVNGRSSSLLKYKDFIDITADVIDVVPSEKNPEQGVVHCQIDIDGKIATYGCGMKFSHKEREEILTNKADYIGKTAEIRFFEYTDDGLPRFPVCVGFRLDK